jgi:hypothetical protein
MGGVGRHAQSKVHGTAQGRSVHFSFFFNWDPGGFGRLDPYPEGKKAYKNIKIVKKKYFDLTRRIRLFLPFGPPAGSIGQRYESGSFYHQAKIVSNLDSYCFVSL